MIECVIGVQAHTMEGIAGSLSLLPMAYGSHRV